MKLGRDEARQYGAKGGRRRIEQFRYAIETEHLTVREIAARLGVSRPVAFKRLQRAIRNSGPVTWDQLRVP